MRKKPISATIDADLIKWINQEIKTNKIYRNKSHLIEVAIEMLRNKNGK